MRSRGWEITAGLVHRYVDFLGSSMIKKYGVPARDPMITAKEILDVTDFDEPERYLAAFTKHDVGSLEVRHESKRKGIYHLSFSSPYKKILQPPNKTVHATLYRANVRAHRVILWVGTLYASGNRWDHAIARRLAYFGFDVCLLVLPYHGPRAGGEKSGLAYFVRDPVATNEAFTQSALDLNRLYDVLHTTFGYSRLFIVGVSSGASVAEVSTWVRPYEGAVFIISGAPLSKIFWEASSFGIQAIRNETAQRFFFEEVDALWAMSDVARFRCRPQCSKYLMINGLFDTVARPAHARRLFSALPGCEMLVYPSGHYNALLFIPPAFLNILRFFRGEPLVHTTYSLDSC